MPLQEHSRTARLGNEPQPQLDTTFTDAANPNSHNGQQNTDQRRPLNSQYQPGGFPASKHGAQAERAQHAAPAEVQQLTQALATSQQRAAAAELAVNAVQRSCKEAVEQSTRLQAEHQRQLSLVFQQHTAQVVELRRNVQTEESLKWRQHFAALEGQYRGAKERADRLEEELRSARACIPWTPAAHEFAQLERKITELEAEQQQSAQESPLHNVLSTQQQALLAQPALVSSLQVGQVEDRDEETERFRTELDSILAIAQELQQQ